MRERERLDLVNRGKGLRLTGEARAIFYPPNVPEITSNDVLARSPGPVSLPLLRRFCGVRLVGGGSAGLTRGEPEPLDRESSSAYPALLINIQKNHDGIA